MLRINGFASSHSSQPERSPQSQSKEPEDFSRSNLSRFRLNVRSITPLRKAFEMIEERAELAQLIDDPELFRKMAEPLVLSGNFEQPTLLFFGGLGGTGYPWRKTAEQLNREWGNRSEVYSLAGHDGSVHSLSKVSFQEWVEDIIAKAEAASVNGKKVIFFGFSTSALAVLEAVSQRSELFGALILVGTPLRIRNGVHSTLLRAIEWLDRFQPGLFGLTHRIHVQMSTRTSGDGYTEEYLKSPRFNKIPISTLVSLMRLQNRARRNLDAIECPVLIVQGSEDRYIKRKTTEKLYARIPSLDKEIVLFEGAPHPVMLGADPESFQKTVAQWLKKLESDGKLSLSAPARKVKPSIIELCLGRFKKLRAS